PRFLLWLWGDLMSPEILEEFQILDLVWMIFRRGTQAIVEAKLRGIRLFWKAAPLSGACLLVASRHGNGKVVERQCRFPLLPPSRCSTEHEEVRGVPLRGVST